MPKPFQFRAGSVIYFQGDTANTIYILQSGRVSLNYVDMEKGEDVHDQVSPGEFFGVKSALGRYPREENAVALQDAMVMAFSVSEFETLAQANTRIILKMLKVFSNQLRRIHRQVSSIIGKTDETSPEDGLFDVGEYYLKNKRFSQAKYVFSRYLTYYPSGKNAARAAKNLEIAENAAKNESPQAVKPKAAPASEPAGESRAYYNAISLISQEKYQQAYMAFKKIIDADEDKEYAAKSSYDLGRCLYFLNRYDECIKYYTGMITKYPRHSDLGSSLFFMGQSYEKIGRKDQAGTFYKKILTMNTDEDETVRMKAKRALDALAKE